MARNLGGPDLDALMLDDEHVAARSVVVTLSVTADGTRSRSGCGTAAPRNRGQGACWPTWSAAGCASSPGLRHARELAGLLDKTTRARPRCCAMPGRDTPIRGT